MAENIEGREGGFRRKLLLGFALTVALSVGAVTWTVSTLTRRAFERANEQQTASLIAQFRQEFARRGEEVTRKVLAIAHGDVATRMALAASRGSSDYSVYVNEAKALAEAQELDFLEFVDRRGIILSSAQWPAKFGYKDDSLPGGEASAKAFLRVEELPEGAALSLSAMQEVDVGDKPVRVIGGRRLDRDFLRSLELPAGMRVMLYRNFSQGFSPQSLTSPEGQIQQPQMLASVVGKVQQDGHEVSDVVHWSESEGDDESVHAIPLSGQDGRLLGILLVGNTRRPYVELRNQIRTAALLAGIAGIVLASLFSGWAAARVTRPVEQLAQAAREVSAGNWNTRVPEDSGDELGALAASFNHMTEELLEQKERRMQAERLAAWRELARRLAHELKNPLFPLQLTVENLVRARERSPEQFEEVFRESASTLLAEIGHLKAIVARFSEFSRMPQPHFQQVQVNDILRNVVRLLQAQLGTGGVAVECKLDLDESLPAVAGDEELLHRAFSNLAFNALEAMPQGGRVTLRTRQNGNRAGIEISDTGPGMTKEECERLFTPYYTTKAQGTGLGLAIAQSVVSDHGGQIRVSSEPGQGTTFSIELPANWEKLRAGGAERPAGATIPSGAD